MAHQETPTSAAAILPELPLIKLQSTSSSFSSALTDTPTSTAARKIGIAVDLSDESAYAVKWAVDHYLRPGDAVVLLHVRPSSVRFGADWGAAHLAASVAKIGDSPKEEEVKKLEAEFDAFTSSKAADVARPLVHAQVPYKIHIAKDRDMKERLCLEIERLGFDAVIMGSRGYGATKSGDDDGRLGSVSDYCLQHCTSPVVVVRRSEDKNDIGVDNAIVQISETEDERFSEEGADGH